MRDLNVLAQQVHAANEKWWLDLETGERIERNKGEQLMLMVSELAEAMEGARKGLMDDKIPSRPMEEVEMADFVIRVLDYAGGHGHRLGDSPPIEGKPFENKGECLLYITHRTCLIRFAEEQGLFNVVESMLTDLVKGAEAYCEAFGLDLWGAYEDKMAYNLNRPDHKLEARLAEGGKKW